MNRRSFLGAAALALATGRAGAAAYPSGPIRMIVPFPPGGAGDVVARPLCERLTAVLGAPVVPDYIGGAGGAVAAEKAAAAAPDGYTMILASTGAFATGPNLTHVRYSPTGSFAAVGEIAESQYALVVPPASPIHDAADLVARAKVAPGTLTYGSPGVGSLGHMAMELLQKRAAIKLVHVPYRGQSGVDVDLFGGRLDMAIAGLGGGAALVRAGHLRALAVTGGARSRALPEVATFAEAFALPGYAATVFWGLAAPKGTSQVVVTRLNAALAKVAADPTLSALWTPQGQDIVTGSPQAFAALIASELAKWKGVVADAHIPTQ